MLYILRRYESAPALEVLRQGHYPAVEWPVIYRDKASAKAAADTLNAHGRDGVGWEVEEED